MYRFDIIHSTSGFGQVVGNLNLGPLHERRPVPIGLSPTGSGPFEPGARGPWACQAMARPWHAMASGDGMAIGQGVAFGIGLAMPHIFAYANCSMGDFF